MKTTFCACLLPLTIITVLVVLSFGFAPMAAAAGGYSFSQVNFVWRTGTEPHGITADGMVIAGTIDPYGNPPRGFYEIVGYGFLPFEFFGGSTEIRGICGTSDHFSLVGTNVQSGFVWVSSKTPITFSYPVNDPIAYYTEAMGINTNGQIVGRWRALTSSIEHGFLGQFDEATLTFTPGPSIDYPASIGTVAYGINEAGQIVGVYTDAAGVYHGFLRETNTTFTSIDYPGATSTFARGINSAGQIVGYYVDGSSYHGFLRSSTGNFSKLDAPGAANTYAYGINDAGQIVGSYIAKGDPLQVVHGFLFGPK